MAARFRFPLGRKLPLSRPRRQTAGREAAPIFSKKPASGYLTKGGKQSMIQTPPWGGVFPRYVCRPAEASYRYKANAPFRYAGRAGPCCPAPVVGAPLERLVKTDEAEMQRYRKGLPAWGGPLMRHPQAKGIRPAEIFRSAANLRRFPGGGAVCPPGRNLCFGK